MSMYMYVGMSVAIALPIYQTSRIIRMYLNKNEKKIATHHVKISFTEPTKNLKAYSQNIQGLLLGLKFKKVRGQIKDFKHISDEDGDIINVYGSEKQITRFFETRDSKASQKINSVFKLSGSIKKEEMFEIETK